jgi:hypothetical protein
MDGKRQFFVGGVVRKLQTHRRYDKCTFYASSEELSTSSLDADYCCNAYPSEFATMIGALPGPAHPHDWVTGAPVVVCRLCRPVLYGNP